MFHWAEHPGSYRFSGLVLVLLHFALFVLGLPPFHAGLWMQTEPVALGLYALSAGTGLWLALGVSRAWLARASPLPLTKALLVWTGWQLIPTVLAVSPWRSWFGPPQTGEGMGWHVSLLLTYLMIDLYWMRAKARGVLLGGACFAVAVQCFFYLRQGTDGQALYPLDSWTPVQWPSYLAFVALYTSIALLMAGYSASTRRYFLHLLVLAAALLVSHNRSAMVLVVACMAVALAAYLGCKYIGLRGGVHAEKWGRYIAATACCLPVMWIVFCAVGPGFAPQLDMFASKEGSVASRAMLNQVGVSAMGHEPLRLVTGGGWGRFADDMFRYVLVDGVTVYQEGVRKPNSFMVDGGAFHSHNQPLEALLSLGMVGFILWFAVPVMAMFALPASHYGRVAPLLFAVTLLGSFWFELIECIPFHALALASLRGRMQSRHCEEAEPTWQSRFFRALGKGGLPRFARNDVLCKNSLISSRHGIAAGLLVAALAMGWSAMQQAHLLLYDARLILWATRAETPMRDDGWVTEDIPRGGDRIRAVGPWLLMPIMHVVTADAPEGEHAADIGRFARLAQQLAASPMVGPYNAFLDLWMRYTLLATPEAVSPQMYDDARASMTDAILAMAQRAPLRDDLATHYLQQLEFYTHGDAQRQISILHQLLRSAPEHRGALWTLGTLEKQAGAFEAGEAKRQRALALGLERVYPRKNEERKLRE